MTRARLGIVLGCTLFVLAWFATIGERPLHYVDESRFAEIAREMAASGDWVTPRLNGSRYFGKPPLQMWVTAIAFSVAGLSEFAARLWPALTGLAAVAAAAFVAMRLGGAAAGLCAAAMLASSLLFVVISHIATLDMGLTLFSSAAVFAFALAQHDGVDGPTRRRWMLAAWACAALAVLSKGPIGIVLPVAAIGAYVLVQRDWNLLGRLHLLAGGALFVAIAAPWFVAVASANPEYLRFYIVSEHVDRFLTEAHARNQPFWYFVPVLLAGLAPWTLGAVASLGWAWRADAPQRFRPLRFLLVWSVVTFVFFSVSKSKLPSYIVLLVPAVAVICGCWLPKASRRLIGLQAGLAAIFGAAFAILAPLLAAEHASDNVPDDLVAAYVPWLVGAAIALALCAAAAVTLEWRARRLGGVVALACGGLLFAQLALAGFSTLSPVTSARGSALAVAPRIPASAPVFSVGTFDPSVAFYLRRALVLVAYVRSRSVSVIWERELFIPTLAEFEKRWREAPTAFAVMSGGSYGQLLQAGLPMTVLARDPRRVFVEKPAADGRTAEPAAR